MEVCVCVFVRARARACIPTQQLIEGIEDWAPRLPCLPPDRLSKIGCTAVDVQAINTLQYQADHALQVQTGFVLRLSSRNPRKTDTETANSPEVMLWGLAAVGGLP